MTENKEYSAGWWCHQLDTTDKEFNQKWRDSANKVEKRYLDEREDDIYPGTARRYNIFWANVQILKSALYATPPAPEVKRQHGDAKDDVARVGALMLERMLTFGLQKDNSDDHHAFQSAVEDRLVPGMGQVWLRYDARTQDDQLVDEQVIVDYVNWRDFYFSPARVWNEVWWVGRRVWMKKHSFQARFGKDKLAKLEKDLQEVTTKREGYPKGFERGRIEVFELWCEATRKVYWLHRGTQAILDQKDDPYRLNDFFPCPPPLLATHSTSQLLPRSDYVLCQDQYDELDTLNDRIYSLTKALRVVGVYDAGTPELANILSAKELNMVPVDNWAAFGEKGGMQRAVDWFPVEQVQKVLAGLIEQRQLVIQQIYELTSISDIMRGASQPRETAKAQTLKAQYSSVRLQLTQSAVAKFVCAALRIKSEIICNLFQPESIIQQSQVQHTESAQLAQPAVELLKNFDLAQYRIYIGEESLSLADYNAERESRTEFLMGIGQFLSQAAPLVQGMPGAMPYLLKMIQWVAASFRAADDIEAVLDEAVAAAANLPMQPQEQQKPPPPDHSVEVANINAQATLKKAEMDNQTKLQIADADRQAKAAEQQANMSAEKEHKQMELDFSAAQQVAEKEGAGVKEEQVLEGIGQLAELQIKLAEHQSGQLEQVQQQLLELAMAVKAPRKRIPTYDANGDITEVRDVIEEVENGNSEA